MCEDAESIFPNKLILCETAKSGGQKFCPSNIFYYLLSVQVSKFLLVQYSVTKTADELVELSFPLVCGTQQFLWEISSLLCQPIPQRQSCLYFCGPSPRVITLWQAKCSGCWTWQSPTRHACHDEGVGLLTARTRIQIGSTASSESSVSSHDHYAVPLHDLCL